MIIENTQHTNGSSLVFSHHSEEKIRTSYRLWYGSQYLLLYTEEFLEGKRFYSPTEVEKWASENYTEDIYTYMMNWLSERVKARGY